MDNDISDIKKKIYYNQSVKKAIYNYRENHREQYNEYAKNYYNKIKDTDEYKLKKAEYNKRYLQKIKEKKQQEENNNNPVNINIIFEP